MARRVLRPLGPLEVVAVFRALLLLAEHHFRRHVGLALEIRAHRRTRLRVVGNVFGDDVARARQRGFGVGNLLFGIDKLGGFRRAVGILIFENELRKRLEPPLLCDCSARATFGLERLVDVFNAGESFGGVERGGNLGGQKLALLERLPDGGAAVVERGKSFQIVADFSDGNFVERTRRLFSITRNKRHGRALLEQLGYRTYPADGNVRFRRDFNNVVLIHIAKI